MMTRLLATSLLALTTLAACESGVEDELAGEDTTELSDGKADATGTYTYYTVTHDQRRCASPYCGGYWVARVNRTTTRCGDGAYAASCYVADVDWAKLGLGADALEQVQGNAQLVVRATVGQKTWFNGAKLGQLRPTEAWLGQGPNAPDGVFVKVEETGTRCITTPCPTFRENKLNGSGQVSLAELGWDHADVDDELVGPAINELFVRDLIIAGSRYTVRGPGGTGKARTVTQFYTRARDRRHCFVGGCSGQVCSNFPGVITTCEARPEYACYANATCEEQVEGECGWTETAELNACLAHPPTAP